jgi:hypothetical protein
MIIVSKATGAEMEISDKTWAEYKAQNLQAKFRVKGKGNTPPEAETKTTKNIARSSGNNPSTPTE